MFRVDVYGNVLYWDADPGSPLAWEVDHWFPQARGGKTVPGNLRLVQWQVCQRKGKKLEFLVPWWDLQLGVSVNQFLSVFSSKNSSFRHRAFSFFFLSGENEQLNSSKVVQGHSWPRHFRERKNKVGLAAAAFVQLNNTSEEALLPHKLNNVATKQGYASVGFAGNNGDLWRREWQNLDVELWKDNGAKNQRIVDFTLDKENEGYGTELVLADSKVFLQKEQQWRQLIEKEKKQKLEESMQLEEASQLMKAENVKEKAVLEQLEQNLAKQKKRVEKQRQWLETQSQYRLCLEKMIRDTLHQCVVYKEQARLNQAACNALLARLESQKSACDVAEEELARKVKQRKELEASARQQITKRGRHHGHTDVGCCLKPGTAASVESLYNPNTNRDQAEVKGSLHLRSSWRQEQGRGESRHEPPNNSALEKQRQKLQVRDKYALQASGHLLEEEKYGEDVHEFVGQYHSATDGKRHTLQIRDNAALQASGHRLEEEKYEDDADEDEFVGQYHSATDRQRDPLQVRDNHALEASGHLLEEENYEDDADEHEFVGQYHCVFERQRHTLQVRDKNALQASVHILEEEGREDDAHEEYVGQYLEENDEESKIVVAQCIPEAERKTVEATGELDVVLLGYEYQENEADNANREESVGDNCTTHHSSSRNYSDEEDDDARNGYACDDDAYDESNNGDHIFASEDQLSQHFSRSRTTDDHLQDEQRSKTGEPDEVEEEPSKQQSIAEDPDEKLPLARTDKTKDEEQLDELLQEVLTMQERVNEAMIGAIRDDQDEESIKAVGKINLDKWLQKLLLDSSYGKGQGPTEPISFLHGAGCDSSKHVDCPANECRDSSEKEKKPHRKMDRPELVNASARNDVSFATDNDGLGGRGKESKKPDRRTSPWRWVSPAPKRSASVGIESRARRLSPWRRSSKEDKAEERKMLEDFSRLRVGGEKQQMQRGGDTDASTKAREKSASAKLKSRIKALPQGIRERSISTPPAKVRHASRLALSPTHPSTHDAGNSRTGYLAGQMQHRQRDPVVPDTCRSGDRGGEGSRGGVSRKANLLRKSATFGGGNGDVGNETVASSSGRVAFKMGEEEGDARRKGSLFEDLDPQDGLRASLSLAWKRAVKKFELGRPPQSAHLDV
ncbi:hypothetical protein KP509_06G074700 [Ceratopteris richardii]|nr:hypothetical protein KP509_06G074700 [Ceratopteris richardii]